MHSSVIGPADKGCGAREAEQTKQEPRVAEVFVQRGVPTVNVSINTFAARSP
jgi:hypothetical protein